MVYGSGDLKKPPLDFFVLGAGGWRGLSLLLLKRPMAGRGWL